MKQTERIGRVRGCWNLKETHFDVRYIRLMDEHDWHQLRQKLIDQSTLVQSWEPCNPEPDATRCEFSRHRTLAHLRACQEQWLIALLPCLERDNPSVKILHPWRKFTQEHYDAVAWEAHMSKYMADRQTWIQHLDAADPGRHGKLNGKVISVGTLTTHLAEHEIYHIDSLRD